MFILPIEVRVTFSARTACGASVMNKARHSSGTCPSAANEPEPPCLLQPLTSITALRDWVGVLRLSPQLSMLHSSGIYGYIRAGALIGLFFFFFLAWPWIRWNYWQIRGKRWDIRGIRWSLYPSCQFKAANYLVWDYPEACLHLELCCFAGRSCCGSRVSTPRWEFCPVV